MRKYVVRAYVLGECVMGDNDTMAETAEEAREACRAQFFKTPSTDTMEQAPKLCERIIQHQGLARTYGLTITARPSKAA